MSVMMLDVGCWMVDGGGGSGIGCCRLVDGGGWFRIICGRCRDFVSVVENGNRLRYEYVHQLYFLVRICFGSLSLAPYLIGKISIIIKYIGVFMPRRMCF